MCRIYPSVANCVVNDECYTGTVLAKYENYMPILHQITPFVFSNMTDALWKYE